MNLPVFDYAEIKVRQVPGTECLQQSNNFAIIVFLVCFCNLGEGAEREKSSVSVCITPHRVTAPMNLNLQKLTSK